MDESRQNYTPLDITNLSPKKKPFFSISVKAKKIVGLVLFLTFGVGMIGYLLILRKPLRKAVPAYLTGESTACKIKIGPPISGSEKIEGNKYSIQIPVKNTGDSKKRVKLSTGWFACPFNDQQTCTQGDGHKQEKEYDLSKGEQKLISITAEQPEGVCGSLQIDLRLKAVKKAGDDDDDDDDGARWDESCNTNSTWVGGFYSFPQACGVVPTIEPTSTPIPTPTVVQPTETPTPIPSEITPTPTTEVTGTITPTEVPSGSPIPTATPSKTPTPTSTTSKTPTPTSKATTTPTPTSGTTTQDTTPGPTSTPIPVACGTKSCDETTNPCRSGLICIQANDGSNYCSLPEFEGACKENPTQASCCTTPTEIILVQATSTPAPGEATTVAKVTEIPPAGIATFGKIFAIISAVIILFGLIL